MSGGTGGMRGEQAQVIALPPHAMRRGDAGRLARLFRELVAVPLSVVFAFMVLSVVSIVADETKSSATLNSIRSVVSHVIGKSAATSTLSAIATGLVTVTSITFSVLLVAVQQTASNLSPVVFDQFMRRKTNQAFLGFFVGLALFAYVVLAAVTSTPPILGAAFGTVLTVVALFILLALVYTTVDQMRPTNVLATLHDRVLQARDRESELVRRTRRCAGSRHPVVLTAVSHTTGYVTGIDIDTLARALSDPDEGEVVLHVTLGDSVAYGDAVATVHDGDTTRARELADAVGRALQMSRGRDVANDPTTGVDQIGNIAWTSGSTSKHNPEVAREALHALRDLAARWLEPLPEPEGKPPDVVPVVYADPDLDRILDWLYSLAVVAHESHQHMLAADVLDAYADLLGMSLGVRLPRVLRDLRAMSPLLDQLPPSPVLDAARSRLGDRLAELPSDAAASLRGR